MKKRELKLQGRKEYERQWGNYQSDNHKSRAILHSEIQTILVHGEFSKSELIEIRDFLKEKGFGHVREKHT